MVSEHHSPDFQKLLTLYYNKAELHSAISIFFDIITGIKNTVY
jgi:hypothetical protein